MKVKAALELAASCGLTTYGEAILNIRMHKGNLFSYDEVVFEVNELENEYIALAGKLNVDRLELDATSFDLGYPKKITENLDENQFHFLQWLKSGNGTKELFVDSMADLEALNLESEKVPEFDDFTDREFFEVIRVYAKQVVGY